MIPQLPSAWYDISDRNTGPSVTLPQNYQEVISMASQTNSYQCPACTGPLHFDAKTGRLVCEYCGSAYDVKQIEELYAGRNQQAAEAAKDSGAGSAGEFSADELSSWGRDAEKMRAYSCTSCGAELICEKSTAAVVCPYCSNPTVIPSQFDGILKPDYVLPFKKTREEAVAALKAYYGKKILLPGSFQKGSHIEKIQGVYVPFWMFNGTVDASGTYEACQEHKERRGDTEITTKKIFDVRREGTIGFEKVPADASSRMSDDLMDSIEPYDYKDLKPFSLSYLPGYLADKYDVDEKECRERAGKRAAHTAAEALKKTVKGYDSVDTRAHHEDVSFGPTQYALMPVWMLSTSWNGRNFLFAMNGQSGKMTGDLPVSAPRTAGLFAVLAAALFFLGTLLFRDSAVIPLIIALLVSGLTVLIMRSGMKPVARKTQADAYVTGGSSSRAIQLRLNTDRYVRTTQSSRKIEQKKK